MRRILSVLLIMLVAAGCERDGEATHARPVSACEKRIHMMRDEASREANIVHVFLTDAAASNLDEIADQLADIDGVERTKTETKDEALARAKKLFKDSPRVMDNLPGNPFPASVNLTVDPDRASEIATQAEQVVGVDEAQAGGLRALQAARAYEYTYEHGNRRRLCGQLAAMDELHESDASLP
jgi:hypothetical protein